MERNLQIAVLIALALAGATTFVGIYEFSQVRFFSIDEFQYGHATWLVSQGRLPYVDFFEHHFPLSYVLHAPLYWLDWEYVSGALLLRKVIFGYLLLVSLLAGFVTWRVTKSPMAGLLTVFLPASFGFSLMSAIDYRADNVAAFYFLACLLLLEWNRAQRSRTLAVLAGFLAALAALMTQKVTFIAGGAIATMLVLDLLTGRGDRLGVGSRLARWLTPAGQPFIARPAAFCAASLGLGLGALAIGALLGILPAGFETTIVQAAEHEEYYEAFSIFEKGFVTPFWQATWLSSLPILLFALGHLATRRGLFWLFPIGWTLIASQMMVAPYPYNFVFLCLVGVLVAVRGFCDAILWLAARVPALSEPAALLHLVALAALLNQLAFISEPLSNDHQLRVFAKIEKYGSPDDAVIDNAGGAMFSRDASYYYYHGDAHRRMFEEYFSGQLTRDYRDSRALFWIRDLRSKYLPKHTRDFLKGNYVHGGGDLWALGQRTPRSHAKRLRARIRIIREGSYYLHRDGPRHPGAPKRRTDLLLDGVPVTTQKVHLRERAYDFTILPWSPPYLITLVDASFFDDSFKGAPKFSQMFQYKSREQIEADKAATKLRQASKRLEEETAEAAALVPPEGAPGRGQSR